MSSTRELFHNRQRALLLEKERSLRHDSQFSSTSSDVVRQAHDILQRIRHQDIASWNTNEECGSGAEPLSSPAFAGMPFSAGRERMEKTDLWVILSKMPKACLLHAHMEAMLHPCWIIDQALKIPGFCLFSHSTLRHDVLYDAATFGIAYRPGLVNSTKTSIWSPSYTPETLVPIVEAAETYPGGTQAFRQWISSHMHIVPSESVMHHEGIDMIWKKFISCFTLISGIFYVEPVFRRFVAELLRQLHDNNIKYVELRLSFMSQFQRVGMCHGDSDFTALLECFGQELKNFMSSPQGQGFWGSRIIWTTLRSLDDEAIQKSMLDCLRCKQRFPDLICGFDFVGQEDKGRTLQDLLPICLWFQQQCQDLSLVIPFFFHAGECLGHGNDTDENVLDAILLGSRRIGHGFTLYKHPILIEQVKARQILIEVCPISQEVLRLTSSILTHPLPALLARGVATSLNNDDPGILGYGRSGLTHDFCQVVLAFEGLGLIGLAAMVENSIRWSAFEDQGEVEWLRGIDSSVHDKNLKADRLSQWHEAFNAWCQWIVEMYHSRI